MHGLGEVPASVCATPETSLAVGERSECNDRYWMHRGEPATAKECFNAASQMLVMSWALGYLSNWPFLAILLREGMDCFDNALQSFISEEAQAQAAR